MKTLRILALMTTLAATALADGKVGFTPADTVASVLTRQVGQRVELRMKSGEKLAGKVEAVGEKLSTSQASPDRNFLMPSWCCDQVSAVIIRTAENNFTQDLPTSL